jgi:aspartokinase/homoserine dehydrogenase 1
MLAIARFQTARNAMGVMPIWSRSFSALPNFDTKISIGIVGYGGIGRELVDQVGTMVKKSPPGIKLRGIADIEGMCLNPAGMTIGADANKVGMGELDASTPMTKADLDAFAEGIVKEANHAVIADCTASEFIAKKYTKWLKMGINVVTPNKKAGSGDISFYKEVMGAARSGGTQFGYEASVGAALPVILTIQDFKATGDEIESVVGIFSGTLSYIFNVMSATGAKFSDVVAEAAANGFTEPDPRDDLFGTDVQRKCVIVARECGLMLNMDDVPVESLVPPALNDWKPAEGQNLAKAFVEELKPYDSIMEEKLKGAAGGVLRYVGTVDLKAGKASVELKAFPSDHVLAGTKHADNVVIFNTKRYTPQPLVLVGPGAGIPVTAGGVFADLLRQVPTIWVNADDSWEFALPEYKQ